MPISLLESQFASLEDPRQESDVYTIDCMNGEDAVLSKLHQFISGIISNEELK
jgi:gluconate kinase